MRNVKPSDVWDARPWGTPMFNVADFNGDGRNEILFVQSAGAHANSAFDPRSRHVTPYKTGVEDQELFCMTLTDGAGKILWQIGEPWRLERPFSWNGDANRFYDLADINGDGRREILLVHKGELRVYSARDGRLLRALRLPNEAFTFAQAVKTDHSGRCHIFTKSGSESETHSYGNPSLLLDNELRVVWEKEAPGAGHRANHADIDHDGLDEILIGFSMFDHDGAPLWSQPPLGPDDHLDHSAIADMDGDGEMSVAMAHDDFDAEVRNASDGVQRFRIAMHHCQTISAGKFIDGRPGLQLVCCDKAVGDRKSRQACVVDRDGREISRHPALGYYEIVNWPTDYGPQSFLCCERPPEPDGEYRVVWLDPFGAAIARFEARASFHDHILRHGLHKLHPEYPVYLGAGLTSAIGDVDGDGRDEVLVTDREKVWVFKAPVQV